MRATCRWPQSASMAASTSNNDPIVIRITALPGKRSKGGIAIPPFQRSQQFTSDRQCKETPIGSTAPLLEQAEKYAD